MKIFKPICISGHFLFGKAKFTLYDEEQADILKCLYCLEEESVEEELSAVAITILPVNRRYVMIKCNGEDASRISTWPQALGLIDELIDEKVRTFEKVGCSLMHASSCMLNGVVTSFVGLSGSGKTTMSIAASQLGGGYLGDERAFVDTSKGTLFHERGPVKTKLSGKGWSFDSRVAHYAEGYDGQPFLMHPACYLTRSIEKEKHQLGCLVFPEYVKDCCEATCESIDAFGLVGQLLPSVCRIGESRKDTLYSFINMISKYNILVYKLVYGNCEQAAKVLAKKITEG